MCVCVSVCVCERECEMDSVAVGLLVVRDLSDALGH